MSWEAVPLLVTAVLVIGAALGTVAVLLRTPVRLIDLDSRLQVLEATVAAMDANVKKALRRAGVAEKRAKEEAPPPEENLPFPPPMSPNDGGAPFGGDPLTLIRREIARRRL